MKIRNRLPDAVDTAKEAPKSIRGIQMGKRSTLQRDVILEVLTLARGPLSVPEIHERSQKAHPGIGLSTIYRTLKLLHQSGYVEGTIFPSGESRFEVMGEHNEHFQCRRCHQVFTLSVRSLAVLNNSTLEGGFVVEHHELTLYGTCPLCVPARQIETQ